MSDELEDDEYAAPQKGLFDFVFMAPYEERKVARFEKGKLVIDACLVSDSNDPYETAVMHPRYGDGKWIIVQVYGTKEDAQKEEWRTKKISPAKKKEDF